jgi:hypothetical protein
MSAKVHIVGRVVSVLLGLLLLAAVVGWVAGLVRDNTFAASASVAIEAPTDAIHPFVASPRQHVAWMGWDDGVDPSLSRSYEGSAEGEGAIVRWTGQQLGTGSLHITESTPDAGVAWTQQLPNRVVSRGRVRYERLSPERTRVTWTEEGTIPRPHGPFFTGLVARSLQPHMEQALLFLAAAAEGRPPPASQRRRTR